MVDATVSFTRVFASDTLCDTPSISKSHCGPFPSVAEVVAEAACTSLARRVARRLCGG